MKDIIVTTGDLKREYEVIGPIYFQVSNKGFFTSKFSKLIKKYTAELKASQENPRMDDNDWRTTYAEHSFNTDSRFEKAFYVSVRELQLIAKDLGADAVVHLHQDIRMDTQGFQYFYMQLYGTAVRFK